MIIEKYYDKKKRLKKMVIKKSSIVNEVIRDNFKLFLR